MTVSVLLPAAGSGERLGRGPKAFVEIGGRNLLQQANAEVVLVHDVARPFVSRALIERVLQGVEQYGAAVPVVAVPDTLIAPQQQHYGQVVPREAHRLVQTPQGFRRDWLLEAHQQAVASGLEATDDAQLVLALGRPVGLVEGDRQLFKLTYPDDVYLAEGLARVWEG